MSKNKSKGKQNNRRPNPPRGPKPPTPRPEPETPEAPPVGVVGVLTILSQVPPHSVFILTDGSTMNTPGVPAKLVQGVRDAIVDGLTKPDDEKPEDEKQDDDEQHNDGDAEIPVDEDTDPAPVEGDAEPGDTVTVPIPEGVTFDQVQAALASALGNLTSKGNQPA